MQAGNSTAPNQQFQHVEDVVVPFWQCGLAERHKEPWIGIKENRRAPFETLGWLSELQGWRIGPRGNLPKSSLQQWNHVVQFHIAHQAAHHVAGNVVALMELLGSG